MNFPIHIKNCRRVIAMCDRNISEIDNKLRYCNILNFKFQFITHKRLNLQKEYYKSVKKREVSSIWAHYDKELKEKMFKEMGSAIVDIFRYSFRRLFCWQIYNRK